MGTKAEAGGPAIFLSKTFADDQAGLEALMPEIDATDGTYVSVLASAAASDDWARLPDVTEKSTIKLVEESEDVWPLDALFRESDVVTKRGIDEIAFSYARRSAEAIAQMINEQTTTVAAGAGQSAQSQVFMGSEGRTNDYRHLLLIWPNQNAAAGSQVLATAAIITKVRATGDMEIELSHKLTTLPAKFKAFAHGGLDAGKQILQFFEITAGQTGN